MGNREAIGLLSYTHGSIVAGWAGEAERAIEWGEKALRLSPFDPRSYAAWHGVFAGHFQQGRFEDAVSAARKAIQRERVRSWVESANSTAVSRMAPIGAQLPRFRFEKGRRAGQ